MAPEGGERPREIAPPDLEWSFGLRGGIVRDEDGTHSEAIALPQVSFEQRTMRGGYSLEGSAELHISDEGEYRLSNASLDAAADYALDAVTSANFSASLETTQDEPGDDIADASRVSSAETTVSVTRQLGGFAATLRSGAARTENGDTVHTDLTTTDNSALDTTDLSVGGRLAVPLTPAISAFVDAGATSERYDVASPSLLVKLDNRTYEASVGLTGKWRDTLSLEGSVGFAYRDFDEDAVPDVSAVIYDASASFRPNETLTLTADLSGSLGAPDADCGCTAIVEHEAIASVDYLVNSWLRLRGSVGASQSGKIDGDPSKTSWNAGVGADYLLNARTDLTADYTFERSTTGAEPAEDTQTLMLGVRVHR
jgi:hypothetical protein